MKKDKFTFFTFLSSKCIPICTLLIAVFFCMLMLTVVSSNISILLFFLMGCLFLLTLWLLLSFTHQKRRLTLLSAKLSAFPDKYLAGELFSAPSDGVEAEYFELMKAISRSAISSVEQEKKEKQDYADYIESFVHELKTPLTAISLILDSDADKDRIRTELHRADDLTETILAYARLRTCEKDFQITKVSMKRVMEQALKQEMSLLISAGISANVQGDFEAATDAKLFSFVLRQLLINCAKYCRGCRISLCAESGLVTVTDNGPGIPSYELPRIFDRGFTGEKYRTGESLQNSSQSTGMGLFIVSELCKKMNILLRAESKEGSFTRFSFEFLQNC